MLFFIISFINLNFSYDIEYITLMNINYVLYKFKNFVLS
jgi:hypothetical protein